jgi:hypothetical protein
MTCRECEPLLAENAFGAELEEHLAACLDCRALAEELQENATALSAMRDEALPVEQALARNGGFNRRTRPVIWIGAAAAAVLLLTTASLWPRKAPVVAPLPPPQVAVSLPDVSVLAVAAPALARPRKARPQKPKPELAHEESVLVKMLTPDPDVVIYWIVGPKEKAE